MATYMSLEYVKDKLNSIKRVLETSDPRYAKQLVVDLIDNLTHSTQLLSANVINILTYLGKEIPALSDDITNSTNLILGRLNLLDKNIDESITSLDMRIDDAEQNVLSGIEQAGLVISNAIKQLSDDLKTIFKSLYESLNAQNKAILEEFKETIAVIAEAISGENDNIRELILAMNQNITNAIAIGFWGIQASLEFLSNATLTAFEIQTENLQDVISLEYSSLREIVNKYYDILDKSIKTESEIMEKLLNTLIDSVKVFTEFNVEDLLAVAEAFRQALSRSE